MIIDARYNDIINRNINILDVDLKGNISNATESLIELMGSKEDELIGKNINEVLFSDVEDINSKILHQLTHEDYWQGELFCFKDDMKIDFEVTIASMFNNENNKMGYTSICKDISDKKRMEQLITTDELTGLFNRRYFNIIFDKELYRARREGRIFALFIMEIDNFNLYTDNYGQGQGDRVLETIGNILNNSLMRASDNAFRFDNDEFAGIMTLDKVKDVESVIERIRKNVEDQEIIHEKSPVCSVVTTSIGVKYIDFKYDSEITKIEMYTEANDALYRAMESGKNKYFVSTS